MSDQLLAKIVDSLQVRPEVKAVWLAGSRGRGTNDEYSDIDIWIAIDDDAIEEVVADPLAYVHEIMPTLMHIVAPGIAPPGGAFVGSWIGESDGFDQVDWYIAPASVARRSSDTTIIVGDVPVDPELFPTPLVRDAPQASVYDNLVMALQMINNMVKHARRSNTWRALDHARHADGCVVKAQWLVKQATEPDFSVMKRSILPPITMVSSAFFRSLAYELIGEVEVTASEAKMSAGLRDAIAALRQELTYWQPEGYRITDTGIQLMSEVDFYASLPRRRVASGLFITNAANEILLLETTYKPQWETPGGHADAGESPRETAAREVIEEIGLAIAPGDLLVIQHIAASPPRGDMLVYLYDGGVIDDPGSIAVDQHEIRAAHFVPMDQVGKRTVSTMTERLHAAISARKEGRLIELSSDIRSGEE